MIKILLCKKCGKAYKFYEWEYLTNAELIRLQQGVKNKKVEIFNIECSTCDKKEER